MKVVRLFSIAAACLLPYLVHAANQVDPVKLAGYAAASDACTRVDQRDSGRYQQMLVTLLKGMSQTSVNAARQTAGYSAAYQTFQNVFAELDSGYLTQLCFASLKSQSPLSPARLPREHEQRSK